MLKFAVFNSIAELELILIEDDSYLGLFQVNTSMYGACTVGQKTASSYSTTDCAVGSRRRSSLGHRQAGLVFRRHLRPESVPVWSIFWKVDFRPYRWFPHPLSLCRNWKFLPNFLTKNFCRSQRWRHPAHTRNENKIFNRCRNESGGTDVERTEHDFAVHENFDHRGSGQARKSFQWRKGGRCRKTLDRYIVFVNSYLSDHQNFWWFATWAKNENLNLMVI